MKNIFKKLKTKRQEKYIRKLEIQKLPLTRRQFIRLCKMNISDDSPIHELMYEWAQKSMERQERENKYIAHFLSVVTDKIRQQLKWEETQEQTEIPKQLPEPKPTRTAVWKNPVFRWIASTTAACMVCLAIILPLTFGGGDAGEPVEGGKEYTALNARILKGEDGIYFDDIYEKILSNKLLMFNQIYSGLEAHKEIYNDETEELLSYVLIGFIVDVSINEDLIVFEINYRIRFVQKYNFLGYDVDFKNLNDNFYIGTNKVKYQIKTSKNEKTNMAFIAFTFGKYDYFLEIKTFEMEDFGVVTEINEDNLIILMQNLIPN